jgi:hypothetical protein
MSVKMTKACDFSKPVVLAEFVNLEATKSFFEMISDLNNAYKFCDTLLKFPFRNCKLEDLRFLTD